MALHSARQCSHVDLLVNQKPVQDNSTVTISDGVTRIGQSGGFGCIESRADVSFPEQYISDYELQQMINNQGGTSN